MKMKIIEISYTKMLKLELPAFARSVIEIIGMHDPEKLKIKEVYDMLVAEMPNIDLLKWPYAAHPLTKPKKVAQQKCILHARELITCMGSVMISDKDNYTESVVNADALIKQYLHRLDLCRSEAIFIERITAFLHDLKRDDEMLNAFTEFKFNKTIEKLESGIASYRNLWMKRKELNSKKTQLKTKEIVAPIREALKYMFLMIEVASRKNTHLDYEPLINMLNETIIELKNTIHRRELYNKRKKKGLK